MDYGFHSSNKPGFKAKESYIVTRGQMSFLRVVGEYPDYDLMTATASEENRFAVCKDKLNLLSSAARLASEIGITPQPRKDRAGREFLFIGTINLRNEGSLDEVDAALKKFFELYDEECGACADGTDDMRDIYNQFAIDDSMGDIYLSDGVWLSSEGSIYDRGR